MKIISLILVLSSSVWGYSQESATDSTKVYKKKVLEGSTLEFLGSYYTQDGSHAAVTGGVGTEELTDIHPVIVLSVPLNDDDVLSVDAGISAYTSASSSNIDPFDSPSDASPFQASSGASGADSWLNLNASYAHSSDDRDKVWSTHVSLAKEFDYFSLGFGGAYTRLFNKKNTELSLKANVNIDSWTLITPVELRPFENGGTLAGSFLNSYTITGNPNYAPVFEAIDGKARNSYSLGLGFSQVLSKRMQGSVSVDAVQQSGRLATPFQRVYFADVADSFIQEFHLADDVERLPDTRSKIAMGGRLHFYVSQRIVIRSLYRFYTDDWGINSHTASITVPIKVGGHFTFYPSYRYYVQESADYFGAYNTHLSSAEFYTSDYDLSGFAANRFGFGIGYTDILRKAKVSNWGLENITLKYHYYERDTDFQASTFSFGIKFAHLNK